MEFIPLFEERYDLIVPEEYYGSPLLAPLWLVLKRADFREAIQELSGYDTKNIGKTIAVVG
jgi:putative molybdopterin biosynthesis protein